MAALLLFRYFFSSTLLFQSTKSNGKKLPGDIMESREKQELIQKLTFNLFRSYSQKGLSVIEYNCLIKDVHAMLKKGGRFSVESVNETLSRLGWPMDIMDSYSFELIITLFGIEHHYEVRAVPYTESWNQGEKEN
jgi:hypothetical protein